jgi:Gas vesicle synthesis protein GvpL/GvpF
VTTGRLELTAAYLVPVESVEAFRGVFNDVVAAHPELTLVCTGPWPPYSFANVGADRS